ncbi:MAG: hybrid sensor histidine kinase/response regulator, partial [Burkholderiaceae bacterium]
MPLTLQGGAGDNAEEPGSILIVDDLPEQLLVLQSILEGLGQNLVFAQSGREALREVLKREFAVILLDVNMPDMDGLETAALIRKYRRSAHTPIIFVTAYADEMQTARGYSLGAVDYILAPVVPEVLRSKLKVFVELNAMQQQVRRQANERVALAAAEAARRAAEQNTQRSQFLSNASRVLSASLDLAVAKRSLLELVVPRIGNAATLVLCNDERRFDRPLHCDSGQFFECDFDECPSPIKDALSVAVITSKPAKTKSDGELVVPLILGGRSLGAIWVRLSNDPESNALLEELSNRAAVAFENARLYHILQTEVVVRQQAEALLQESNQRKDEFLAMLSHELRNPLASIRNAVEVIRLVAPPEPRLTWATGVTDRQVGQLTRLIEELLDVARINRGKIVLQTEPIDLLQVVAQSVETVRPLIESKRHTLTQKISREPIWLHGDFARLLQIVANVLNNAAKYTDEGGAILLSVSIEDGHAVIAVRDNGVGIDAELLPHVFELFTQGEQSLDRGRGGLGVGLTLA